MTREQLLSGSEVLAELRGALKSRPRNEAVKIFVTILRERFDRYNCVGVYLVSDDKLVLETYAGDEGTEHTTIPIGQGVCGYAATAGKTVMVPDVSKNPRYLMCFASTRSEIVVPIMGESGIIGEIDIDSNHLSAFSADDEEFLEVAAKELGDHLEARKHLSD